MSPADSSQPAPFATAGAGSASTGSTGAASNGAKPRDFAAAFTAAKAGEHKAKQPAAADASGAALPPDGNPLPLPATALSLAIGGATTPVPTAPLDGATAKPAGSGTSGTVSAAAVSIGSALAAAPTVAAAPADAAVSANVSNLTRAAELVSAANADATAAATVGASANGAAAPRPSDAAATTSSATRAATLAAAWALAGAVPATGLRSQIAAAAATLGAAANGQSLTDSAAASGGAAGGAAAGNPFSPGSGTAPIGRDVKGTSTLRAIGVGSAAMAAGKPSASATSLRSATLAETRDANQNDNAANTTDSATSAAANTAASAATSVAAAGLSAADALSPDAFAAANGAANGKAEFRVNATTVPGPGTAIATADATPVAAASTVLAQAAVAAFNPAAVDKHGRDGEVVGGVGAAAAVNGSADGAGGATVSTPTTSVDAPAAAAGKLSASLSSPAFPQELAERVAYVVANNLNGATLQVNPPQLGPIELRVTVEAGHAQVLLSAQNPATCDALHASSSKLKEMLSPGFAQVSVDVSQRSFQERSAYSPSYQWTPAPDADTETAVAAVHANLPTAAAGRGLDAYA
jgi:flagellar hook-length control protein FliK